MTNDKTDRIIKRILEVDNFENMACCCDNFSEFVTEILEWGVDHIAGVDFFDSYKSFRDFTFNPELDTIAAALDDYMAYADDEFASQDDLIGGLPVEDRINSIND